MKIETMLAEAQPELTAWRHQIHQHPELAFEETRTAAFVCEKLRAFGLDPVSGVAQTGVICVVEGTRPGRTIAFRADMDALPLHDASGADYSSSVPGKAHACGHDGHTVGLLAVARFLSRHRPLTGRVVLIFQPAEEAIKGAKAMIEARVIEQFAIDEIYAFHNMPLLDRGTAAALVGVTLAGAQSWEIDVEGIGGHGAAFYETVDPLQAAARIAIDISSIVGRYIDPAETGLITVGALNAGAAPNVIPDRATLKGTSRALSAEVLARLTDRVRKICEGVANATECKVTFRILMEAPPCVNAKEQAGIAAAACAEVLGLENVVKDRPPFPFTDDFGYFLANVPGAYFFVGQDSVMCHNPEFDFDDTLLMVASSIFVNIAEQRVGISR